MLNPSTADAAKDDPTVAKCVRLARRWGYGALEVRNIFALRSTNPLGLRKVSDPIGPRNNEAIMDCVLSPDTALVIAAWGNHGAYLGRGAQLRTMLQQTGLSVFCFCLTKENEPAHPLYQLEHESEEELVPYL